MDIIKDKLSLVYSDSFKIADTDEKEIDLSLQLNEDSSSSIIGTVKDENGNPVSGATVKVFDKDGKPFKHALTDEKGKYSFEDLKADNYSVTAVKDGCRLTTPINLILQEDETKSVDFVLAVDPSIALTAIAGMIYDNDTNAVLGGARISLIDAKTLQTVSTTKAADDGEFVFYDVALGDYQLIATKEGYHSSNPLLITVNSGAIINTNIKMTIDPVNNTGTINGVVKYNNQPVASVYVGLYNVVEVDGKKTETLIATTKTNSLGAYMFGNVPQGNYVVKSKQNKIA